MKRFLNFALYSFLLLFAFVLGGAFGRTPQEGNSSKAKISCEMGSISAPTPVAAGHTLATGTDATPPLQIAPNVPINEKAFIEAVERAKARFASGANEMQKGAARPRRAKDICESLKSLAIKDWIGHIEKLSTNADGKGVLTIKIADNVYVQTWNNAISDIDGETLIDPDSPLYQKVSSLKTGQLVSFSGSFIRNKVDCVRESSLTLQGSIESPEFIMRFSNISGL